MISLLLYLMFMNITSTLDNSRFQDKSQYTLLHFVVDHIIIIVLKHDRMSAMTFYQNL